MNQLLPEQLLVIKFNPNTQAINVQGPFGDGILFLGMLEMAKLFFCELRARERAPSTFVLSPKQ